MPLPVRYRFRTAFAVSAHEAYKWCTDYRQGSEDHALMGDASGIRLIRHIADNVVILRDTFSTESGVVKKKKLVELYPDSFSWNATHLTGPAKYSQFLYRIIADGDLSSHLDFEGKFLYWSQESLSEAEADELAKKLCTEDAEAWALLAKAMAEDLN